MSLYNIKNIPLTIVVGFNIFTLFILYTGPYRWATDNIHYFFIYALFSQLLIVLGFQLGIKSRKPKVHKSFLFIMSKQKLDFIFLFYCLTFLMKYAYWLRLPILDIEGMVKLLLIGIVDPKLGYALSLDDSRSHTVSWTVFFFNSIIHNVFFIIGFIKWKDLGKLKKLLFVFFLTIDLFFWMGRGTNFGVISLVTTLSFAALYYIKTFRFNFKQKVLFSFTIVLLFFISIYSFTYTMNSRAGNKEVDIHYFDLVSSEIDENDIVFSIIPANLHQSYLHVVSYLGQGYYHASLAFDLDFKSTLFFGNNPASVNASRIFNFDVWEDTYMYRLREKGVDPLVKWHSAYLWYASDVSFWGVPFLLGFIGYFFGYSWAFSLITNDFLSKVVFVILGNMLLYLFANNSYLSSVFYSLIFIFPIWYFTRVKGVRF